MMKDIPKISAQIIFGLLISWIVTCGVVLAQPLCCVTITDSCIPTFNRIQGDATLNAKCKQSQLHRRSPDLPGIAVSEILPKDVNAQSSCCENLPCDGLSLTTRYNTPSQHYPILKVRKVGSFYSTYGLQKFLGPKFQSVPLQPTSIYILTQSIIC